MGAAARANAARIAAGGTPKGDHDRPGLTARFIDAMKIARQFKRGALSAQVQFSDRGYDMDAKGQLRRRRPQVDATLEYGPGR